jgi:hypothetical protein
MPDAWHVHIYAYSADEWENWLIGIENLLDDEGWSHKNGKLIPIIVSEAAGISDNIEENKRVMDRAWFRVQTDPRLHSVYWFSARYSDLDTAAIYQLLDAEANLTELGAYFVELNQRELETVYLPTISG